MLVAAPHARRFAAARTLAVAEGGPRAFPRVEPSARGATLGWYVLVACAMLNLVLYGVGLMGIPAAPPPLAASSVETDRQTLLSRPSSNRQWRPPECRQSDLGYGLIDPCP